MVRPRLVQAANENDEGEDHIDELLAEEMARNPEQFVDAAGPIRRRRGSGSHRSSLSSASSKGPSASISPPPVASSTGSSSLMRAVGGKLPQRYGAPPPPRATRVTIGCGGAHEEGRMAGALTSSSQHQNDDDHFMQVSPTSNDGPIDQHHEPATTHHQHATHFVIGGGAAVQAPPPANNFHHHPNHHDPMHVVQQPAIAMPGAPYHHQQQQQYNHTSPAIHATHFEIGYQNHHQHPPSSLMHTVVPQQQQPPQQKPPPHAHATHFEIGADTRPTERMEGVQDHSIKAPLVVLDGANIAYAYGTALQGTVTTSLAASTNNNTTAHSRPIPDARGIRVACRYFQMARLRVLAVLPTSWFRNKPRPGQQPTNPFTEQQLDHLEAIHELQQAGLLVSAPPTDDDDAYALTIAQRENVRAQHRQHGPGFVVSNDLFRDAQQRDTTGQLKEWLMNGNNSSSNHEQTTGPGRISFAFGDMGTLDDHGERELDFVPNPRHPLIVWIEQSGVLHQPPST